jgi:arabinose-5-phosphate isomerase
MSNTQDISGSIQIKLQMYTCQLSEYMTSIYNVITKLVSLLSKRRGFVYMSGVGKSGYITQKCVATWQSLGLLCHCLHAQDSLHGDIGVLRPGDIVIYLTNSGNTDELIRMAQHLRGRGLIQISLTNAIDSTIGEFMDHTCVLSPTHKIQEADTHSLVPSVSSTLFMMILDITGICLAEKISYSQEEFKKNHPSGALGR